MKKLFSLIILVLFFVNFAVALDCQYKVNESYEEEETWFYHSGDLFAKNINLSGLVKVEFLGYDIKVTNDLEVPVSINVTYSRDSNWFGTHDKPTILFIVEPNDFQSYEDSFKYTFGCPGFGCAISLIKTKFVEPDLITSEPKLVNKKREVCQICPNGKQCLNDGMSCTDMTENSQECGSRVCNINLICGATGTSTIVPCPDGKLNCNNQTCLAPSIKNTGEAYSCEWECKTGRGKDGVCTFSIRNWIVFLSIVLITTSILVWYFAIFRRKHEEKKLKEIQIAIEKLSHEIDKLTIELEELENKKVKTSRDIEKIKELEEMLNVKQDKLIKLMGEKDKEIEDIEKTKPERKINFLLNEYKNKYETGGRKIEFDNEKKRFMITSMYGSPEPLARYVYKKHIDKNLGDKKIHHINYDQMIDDTWNLVALTKSQHDLIPHNDLIKGDWHSGIEEIKKALTWEDSNFPEHIQKEITKIKAEKQKKSEKYVKRSFKGRR